MISTCCEPAEHPERTAWQGRLVELLVAGVRPCVPRQTLELPGGVSMEFVFVPPGSFLMGSDQTREFDETEPPVPIHKVTLTAGFFLGVYPVSQAQWRAVMGTGPSEDARWIESVSWDDCQEFCSKLTAHRNGRVKVRLPSEAEWEYACRAGTTTEYHFEDAGALSDSLYNKFMRGEGSLPPNAWGLSDMNGTIWAWCADVYAPCPATPEVNPLRQSMGDGEREHVLRGGSWDVADPIPCRAAHRDKLAPAARRHYVGLRVCYDTG